ncbi:MAG: sensor histidine kinase [Lachnospiraceae bacterium]
MMQMCELSSLVRSLLLLIISFTALGEIILIMLNKISRTGRSVHILLGFGMMAVLQIICGIYSCIGEAPVLPAVIVLIVALIHILIETLYCIKYRRLYLSPYAIKEATDNLSSGVCFADATDRIILCNRQMGRLSSELMGSYPQTAGELEKALLSPSEKSSVRKISDAPVLYRFSDGSVWRFRRAELSDGIRQFTAQDVTALHEINENLRADNEELERVNEKLCRMYDRLTDRIREQEILDLKMRIHDNIGTSLIAISDMINHEVDSDMNKQLAILQDAVSYLTDDRPVSCDTFEEARQKAAAMKVSLILKGSIPQDTTSENLIVAAVRECVTNCVNHAKGNQVIVEITEHMNIRHITITNNGEVPKEKIIEGGGLTNLRKSVETAGGEMSISHSPVFALILNLPRKEQNL